MEEKITSELLENYEIALVERELAVLTSTIPDESLTNPSAKGRYQKAEKRGKKSPGVFEQKPR